MEPEEIETTETGEPIVPINDPDMKNDQQHKIPPPFRDVGEKHITLKF